jgi:hypothetical protein
VAELVVTPGSTVELVGPFGGELRLWRFSSPDQAQVLATPAEGVVRIEIPADDDAVASMPGLTERYPYRLQPPPGVEVLTDCP